MESKGTDEPNILTSQVLDYCNRYSRNQNFSSYLRGKADDKEDSKYEEVRPSLTGSENNENNINTGNIIDEQVRFPSPTSSVTSNRKLEWDNLADIGYGNCMKQKSLHKSLSLPVLTTLEKIQLSERKLRLSPEGNVIDHGTQTQSSMKYLPCESVSSSSCKEVSSLTTTETTSSPKENFTAIDTTSTVSSKLATIPTETDSTDIDCTVVDGKSVIPLAKYIGLPMAESTPNNVKEKIYPEANPKIEQNIDLNNPIGARPEGLSSGNNVNELKCIARCFRSNIKHLSLTKPFAVECHDKKQISDKDIQTTIVITTRSIAVQTDGSRENEDNVIENKIEPVYEEKQIVEYVKHGTSSDEPSFRSLGTNTDSDKMSQGNSSEYLHSDHVTNGLEVHKSRIQGCMSDYSPENENIPNKNGNRKTIVENEKISDSSSKANPLAELISTKLSEHVITDVDKSINILQKLLKSKKYDKITKQYYIKKIVQKIANCNYSSETSLNSDVPSPTTDDSQHQNGAADAIKANQPTYTSSDEEARKAQPQEPVNSIANKKINNTFSTEILPEEPTVESCTNSKQSSKLKDARFTILHVTKHKASDELSQIGDVNPDHSLSLQSNPQSSSQTPDSSGESRSLRNWKKNMTKSEKLLEDKLSRMHGGDTTSNDSDLLNFAKKERENQINWINNEINHLHKLKDMLQKKGKRNTPNVEALMKPQPEEMIQRNKTTAVYVITTEKSSISSSSSYKSTRKPITSQSTSKKCDCLSSKKENVPCDFTDCPFLKHTSDKPLKLKNFNKMLKKDIKMLPHLANFPEFECNSDIENAKLIANEVYAGSNPNTWVKRYVFEIPVEENENPYATRKKREQTFTAEHNVRPYIPKLPNCDLQADTQNAKLIASEICKGSMPNTCIRRYVFEIPLFNEDEATGRSAETSTSRTTKSKPPSADGKLRSHKESKPSTSKRKLEPKSSCECNDFLQPTKQDESNKIDIPLEDRKYESSDIVCICQIGDKARSEPCSCDDPKKIPVKVIKADVLSDPRKKYRVCVQKSTTGDIVSYAELPDGAGMEKADQTASQRKYERKESLVESEETVDTHIQKKSSTEFSGDDGSLSKRITKIETSSETQRKKYTDSYSNTYSVRERRHIVSDGGMRSKPKHKHKGTSSIIEASLDDKVSKEKGSYSKGLITGIGGRRRDDSSSDDEEQDSKKGNKVKVREKVKIYSNRFMKASAQRIREDKEGYDLSPAGTSPTAVQVSESINTEEEEKHSIGIQYEKELSKDVKVSTSASSDIQSNKHPKKPKKRDIRSKSKKEDASSKSKMHDTSSSSYGSDSSESSYSTEDVYIPKLPNCDLQADTQNAKLIASEICKGSMPNTCIRRYVFEIPLFNEDDASGRSAETSTSQTTKSKPPSADGKLSANLFMLQYRRSKISLQTA
ncbi:hypothetical protein AMK59_5408 [Oryctes borbonicus]|uniref:Uncharacterized protein n=1 Tax=Oryctes borbonicus TaxID=1629725 RepID=A0A0T6B388_9SCAR|nr:hypothetical protein AMK59_5408 [Oryctes borbonicus]